VDHNLAIVCAAALLVVGACGSSSSPSSSSDPAANDPTTSDVIGAPLALGARVSGTKDATYHFTTARAYTVTWNTFGQGKSPASTGFCKFLAGVTDDKGILDISTNSRALAGTANASMC
jgi:hypothetical protein